MEVKHFFRLLGLCAIVGLWMAAIPAGPWSLVHLGYFSGGFGGMALLFWIEIKTKGMVSGRRFERPAPWPDPPAGPLPDYHCDPETEPKQTRMEFFEVSVEPLAGFVEVPDYNLYEVTLTGLGDSPVMRMHVWAPDGPRAVEIAMALKGPVMAFKGKSKPLYEESTK